MTTVRIVWGTGTGPTAVAADDAALAAAGVHNYNLVPVSSVVPAGATVEAAGTAPDLGPVGGRLTVVRARAAVPPERAERAARACAGLGWALDDEGRGIVYEGAGTDSGAVRETIEVGLAAGRELREWEFVDEEIRVATADATPDAHTATVALAVYGESAPLA